MSAYCLFDNIEVTDPARLEEYKSRVAPLVQRYGGRYVRELKELRHSAGRFSAVFVEGI